MSRVLDGMEVLHALIARMKYGTGLRLTACLSLRMKGVDLIRREITIRGKAMKSPKLPLPPRFPDNAQPEILPSRVIQPHEPTPGNPDSGRRDRA